MRCVQAQKGAAAGVNRLRHSSGLVGDGQQGSPGTLTRNPQHRQGQPDKVSGTKHGSVRQHRVHTASNHDIIRSRGEQWQERWLPCGGFNVISRGMHRTGNHRHASARAADRARGRTQEHAFHSPQQYIASGHESTAMPAEQRVSKAGTTQLPRKLGSRPGELRLQHTHDTQRTTAGRGPR